MGQNKWNLQKNSWCSPTFFSQKELLTNGLNNQSDSKRQFMEGKHWFYDKGKVPDAAASKEGRTANLLKHEKPITIDFLEKLINRSIIFVSIHKSTVIYFILYLIY